MKISDGYLLRTVAGKNIVVSVGADVNLKNNTTKAEMLEKILEEFDVSPQQASQDIDEFIEKLSEAKILED